jgi:hypothetical protein
MTTPQKSDALAQIPRPDVVREQLTQARTRVEALARLLRVSMRVHGSDDSRQSGLNQA